MLTPSSIVNEGELSLKIAFKLLVNVNCELLNYALTQGADTQGLLLGLSGWLFSGRLDFSVGLFCKPFLCSRDGLTEFGIPCERRLLRSIENGSVPLLLLFLFLFSISEILVSYNRGLHAPVALRRCLWTDNGIDGCRGNNKLK